MHAVAEFRTQLLDWLTAQGSRCRDIPEYLASYCVLLNDAGFGIRRCNLATQTVHPQMRAIRHVWSDRPMAIVPVNPAVVVRRRQYELGGGMIDELYFNALNEQNPQYLASPFYAIITRKELYEPIRPAGEKQPFPIFGDLQREGCTAYYGLFLDSFEGIRQQIGLATTLDGGLSARQVEDLRWSLRLFTLHLNTLMEYDIKNTLAGAYIGTDPGRRVMGGMISLGEVVSLEAAIWFSDLRGFTTISDGLSSEGLVEMLNEYFDVVVAPIYEHGGEVLKFIGDAILAVFPVSAHDSAAGACAAARAAVVAAGERLDAMNADRRAAGRPEMRHGVGLHFGEAQYGNIGSRERLDFTLIGREVNIASRIEGLTKEAGEVVLLSEAFVARSGVHAREVGAFRLKGIADLATLYAPA